MSESDYLKKELMKTGFPLEIEISSKLDKKWDFVVNTDSYLDKDENKLRDIDILAYDNLESDKILPIYLRTNLVIECKKEVNLSWVFFTRPFDYSFETINGQYVDETQLLTKNSENFETMAMILEKAPLHYANFERQAVTHCTIYREGKDKKVNTNKKKIFQAQNQLKKYICHTIDLLFKQPRIGLCPIEFYFPCIVFDGPLYEAIFEDGKLNLIESNHLLLETLYRSPYSIYERSILIDVVHKNIFDSYQKLIRKDVRQLRKIVRNKAEKLNDEFFKVDQLLSTTRK